MKNKPNKPSETVCNIFILFSLAFSICLILFGIYEANLDKVWKGLILWGILWCIPKYE